MSSLLHLKAFQLSITARLQQLTPQQHCHMLYANVTLSHSAANDEDKPFCLNHYLQLELWQKSLNE
jgi:hypothetical protein